MPTEPLALRLSARRLVEFLLRTGSIDSRFTGFDRAKEGARLHRKLQQIAKRQHADYLAEVALRQEYACADICYTLEGRADGIYTDENGVVTIEEIKTTTLPPEAITENHAPEHWAQGQVYAAIYALQNEIETIQVQLTYFQVDEETSILFTRNWQRAELDEFVRQLLTDYAPWAKRAAAWQRDSRESLRALTFPFESMRPGQKAMMGEVFSVCQNGGQLLCQAPTGIGKTMSTLYPALKALGAGVAGPVFYLTARGTTRAAAENALQLLHQSTEDLKLRSVTLTAKDKICLCDHRECTPDACPYADGYYSRIKDALWDALDAPALDAATLQNYAHKHTVCPFELGLDLSLWCDVVIGDYNYLFDPVVKLQRFFETKGDYLFLVDEAHNLPGRARDMHTASLCKSAFYDAKKRLGKGKSSLKNQLTKINNRYIEWRHKCEESATQGDDRFGKTLFTKEQDADFDRALTRLCEPLQAWLEEHREPDETHTALLNLFFDVRSWLRVAETFDEHYVLQLSAFGGEVRATQLCLDPSAFLAGDFAMGRAAVLFSATLAPGNYYKDLCGIPQARAVMLRSPFPAQHLGLWCAQSVSTRYKDRTASIGVVADYLAALAGGQVGNYLAFFPSYSYLESVWEEFTARTPDIATLKQQTGMEEAQKEDFLAQFAPHPQKTMLGFAVMGGVFGEGVDLTGDRLIGVAIIGPGLPQVGARQEQLRDYFEQTRGSGFDYAYRYPGMNKVLQAAGRVIRTPQDKGVVLLIDGRFAMPDYRRLMPPHWASLRPACSAKDFGQQLQAFWLSNKAK